MEIGVTAAYTRALRGTDLALEDNLASIEAISGLGIGNLEIEVSRPEHVESFGGGSGVLEAALERHSVRIAGVAAPACRELIHSTSKSDHQDGYRLFDDVARFAARLKASYVHLESDMIEEYRSSIPADVAFPRLLDTYAVRLGRLAGIAHEHGLRFVYEPRADALVFGADSYLRVASGAGSTNISCCLDIAELSYHRENVALAVEKLGTSTYVVHLCNAAPGTKDRLPLAEGSTDIAAVIAALAKVDFQGFLMLDLPGEGAYRDGVTAVRDLLAIRDDDGAGP